MLILTLYTKKKYFKNFHYFYYLILQKINYKTNIQLAIVIAKQNTRLCEFFNILCRLLVFCVILNYYVEIPNYLDAK